MGLLSAFSRDFFGVESPGFGWGFFAFCGRFLKGFWENCLLAGGRSWITNGSKCGNGGLWDVVFGVLRNRHFLRVYFDGEF